MTHFYTLYYLSFERMWTFVYNLFHWRQAGWSNKHQKAGRGAYIDAIWDIRNGFVELNVIEGVALYTNWDI